MIRLLLRLLWRAIILLLGVSALIFLVYALWPDSGSRITAFISFLVIYCVMAYVVIPNLMRLFHIFSKPNHIPLYVTTSDGWPSDPVNLAIVVRNRLQLIRVMQQGGWHQADPLTFRTGFKEFISIVFNMPYPKAPLSHLYLFDRPHDIGFEIPTNSAQSARTRHHVRFWRLEQPERVSRNSSHYEFWRQKMQHMLGLKREVWIGAATEETKPVDIQWRTGRLTHGGSHESDKERDFIIQSLRNTGKVKRVSTSISGEQLRFRGQQFRTFYISDGSIKIIRFN